MTPLYTVRTWDTDAEAYTPQELSVPSENVTLWGLRAALKELRNLGYPCHYHSCREWDNDWAVLVERVS